MAKNRVIIKIVILIVALVYFLLAQMLVLMNWIRCGTILILGDTITNHVRLIDVVVYHIQQFL